MDIAPTWASLAPLFIRPFANPSVFGRQASDMAKEIVVIGNHLETIRSEGNAAAQRSAGTWTHEASAMVARLKRKTPAPDHDAECDTLIGWAKILDDYIAAQRSENGSQSSNT